MPTRLDREVKRLEQRGNETLKASGAQHTSTSDQMQMMKDFFLSQMEQLNDRSTLLKSRLDEHDLKINMVMRNQEHMRQVAASGMLGFSGGGGQASRIDGQLSSVDTENELRLMRGQLQDERSRREQIVVEHQNMISQLQ
jgi:hypothetical protein